MGNKFFIDLDRKRQLVYDFDAWEMIAEKYAPQEEEEEFDPAKMKVTFREIPSLVLAGLAWDDHELTEQKIKDELNKKIRAGEYTILGIINAVTEALFAQAGFKKKVNLTKETEKKFPGFTTVSENRSSKKGKKQRRS